MTHFSRAERLQQLKAIVDASPVTLSTRELAKKMDMAFSPHFRTLVAEAFDNGMIDGLAARNTRGIMTYYWFSKENHTYVQPKLSLFAENSYVAQG